MFSDAGHLAHYIDHTVVRPDSTLSDVEAACQAARRYGFSSVVVPSSQVARVRDLLSGTLVKVCCVVGFPHGTCSTTVKIVEAMEAMKNGASELDIVMNVGLVKSGLFDAAEIDVKNVITMTPQKIHKVIIEAGLLTDDELSRVCQGAVRARAEFIKTSTGFGPRGATVEDIRKIRKAVGAACRIKASGGIRDLATVKAMIEAGAERIGTSAGPAIMEEYLKQK